MPNIAVIGLGDVAGTHLRAISLLPEGQLVAGCDIDPARRRILPEGVPFFTDWQQMVETTAPEVVHLCLPHHLHYPVTRALAEQGIHVLCEKPLAQDLEQARAMVQLARQHPQVQLGLCMQNRLNPATQALKALIEGGRTGRILGIRGTVPWHREASYYSRSPWRSRTEEAGGGCLITQAIHTLDLMQYLAGPVCRVQAMVGQLNGCPIAVETDVVARLEFAQGFSGLFFATNSNWGNEPVQIRLTTQEGVYLLEEQGLYRLTPQGSYVCLAENPRMEAGKPYYGSSHYRLISRFYQALAAGSRDYIRLEEGLAAMELIQAIYRSAAQGRACPVVRGEK